MSDRAYLYGVVAALVGGTAMLVSGWAESGWWVLGATCWTVVVTVALATAELRGE